VYRLSADRRACVRFDRHAVYLGTPNAVERCPAHAAGRTEAVLIQPLPHSQAEANPTAGSAVTLVDGAHRVLVTATWSKRPAVIRRALGLHTLRATPGTTTTMDTHTHLHTAATRPGPPLNGPLARASAASAAGAVYTGLGFDACATPSVAAMSAWGSSPYRAVGVYLGGANMACSQPNLTPAWVAQESAAGWHLIPIYVGLQAPGNSCGCAAISRTSAASQGSAAATDAVSHAQSVGLGPGNPIYFDMEAYSPGATTTTAVLTFLAAWTSQLHTAGYKSGVYSSADSGIRDLAAEYGSGYLEPDDIWVARWNEAKNTIEPNVPATDWAAHQRVHQYDGGHNETHSGVTINVDGDYLDGATAAGGSGAPPPPTVAATPSLSVAPGADGSIQLSPSWSGAAGVSSWEMVGGPAPTSLAPVTIPISTSARLPIVVRSAFAYFAVVALGSTGETLATSAPVATPAHVAIFGNSAFVPARGLGGLPVGCFSTASCHVSTTITAGRKTLVRTGSEHVPPGGGLVYFTLSPSAHRLVSKARHHRLAVRITVHDISGASATRALNLIPFTTSGPSPRRTVSQASGLRIVGTTDFVSSGHVGGILAACYAAAPCHPSTTITAGGKVLARTTPEFLGVNELGYLIFRLTGDGRAMLARARGNQLSAKLTLNDGGTIATGQIVLAAFS
jgi:Rv2525c-like, glycoside hydrolase-like domain